MIKRDGEYCCSICKLKRSEIDAAFGPKDLIADNGDSFSVLMCDICYERLVDEAEELENDIQIGLKISEREMLKELEESGLEFNISRLTMWKYDVQSKLRRLFK